MAVTESESFVVLRFREFYADVIRVRKAVLADPWGISAPQVDETARRQARAGAARTVSERFRELLERQAADAGREGGDFGSRTYAEAQYVMAGLADEIFLQLDWEGREAWSDNLLETQLFGTHLAGEVLFDRLEKILRERDDLYRDLAQVYLLALSLGFKGKYSGKPEAAKQLKEYRTKLLAFVSRGRGSILKDDRHLFPQSYTHTLTPTEGRKLPYLSRWGALLALVCGLYLVAQHLVWKDVTRDLVSMSRKIADAHGVAIALKATQQEKPQAPKPGEAPESSHQ
jgi:type VI secretion system protein ImpK